MNDNITELVKALAAAQEDRERAALAELQARCTHLHPWQERHLRPLARLQAAQPADERRPFRLLAVMEYITAMPAGLRPALDALTDGIEAAAVVMDAVRDLPPEEAAVAAAKHPRMAQAQKAMGRAARVGLQDHPLVQEWIEVHRRLGNWDTLRSARAGLEKGVRRPPNDAALFKAIVARRMRGLSWKAIHKDLIATGIRVPTTYQSFHRLIAGWGLRELYPSD